MSEHLDKVAGFLNSVDAPPGFTGPWEWTADGDVLTLTIATDDIWRCALTMAYWWGSLTAHLGDPLTTVGQDGKTDLEWVGPATVPLAFLMPEARS